MIKFLLINALCLILSVSSQNYTLYKKIKIPNGQKKIAFSDDFRYAFLYDDSTNKVASYRVYDWGDSLNPTNLSLAINPNTL